MLGRVCTVAVVHVGIRLSAGEVCGVHTLVTHDIQVIPLGGITQSWVGARAARKRVVLFSQVPEVLSGASTERETLLNLDNAHHSGVLMVEDMAVIHGFTSETFEPDAHRNAAEGGHVDDILPLRRTVP